MSSDPENKAYRLRRSFRDEKGKPGTWAEGTLARLVALRDATDPNGGDETASGKDGKAFRALQEAGNLVRSTAQWAIDHQIGLATEGLKFVPLGPTQTRSLPEYQQAREQVDSHAHEGIGVDFGLGHLAPLTVQERREILISLLRANVGGFPAAIAAELCLALEALSYGDVLPLLQPVKEGRQAGLVELEEQLFAVCAVHLRRSSKMMTAADAEEVVAEAYGVKSGTLRTWEARLRAEFGRLHVSQRIGFAKNGGSQIAAIRKSEPKKAFDMLHGNMWHGDEPMKKSAERYRAAQVAKPSKTVTD